MRRTLQHRDGRDSRRARDAQPSTLPSHLSAAQSVLGADWPTTVTLCQRCKFPKLEFLRLRFPTSDILRSTRSLAALLLFVVALTAGRSAPASTPEAPLGMVEAPCLKLPDRPGELDARTEIDLKPATPDPAALKWAPDAATLAYFAALDEQHKQDWPNLCRYQAENASVSRDPPPRAVFMGDSITENWRAADPSLFTGGILNRGIGGQTSPQMLLRFYADVIALHPRVVHIMAGTNDLAGNTGPTSAQQYENNIMAMCDLARANGVRVVLAGIPPTTRFPWRPELQPGPQIVELNTWMRQYAAQHHFVYVDYSSVLADAGGAMRAGLSHDGVHPQRTGYALMRPLAEHAIAVASTDR